jgi:hypothetical protein
MKIEHIMEEAEKDAKIDYTEIATASLKTTELIVKWLKIHAIERMELISIKGKHDLSRKDRWEFYAGKGEKPFEHKLLKADIPFYLDNDPELQPAKSKLELQEVKLNFIEGFIKSLHNRGYALNTASQYIMFTSGAR